MYIRLSDSKYPVTLAEIRSAHAHVSIPDAPNADALKALGYAAVTEAPRPSTTPDQKATLATTPDSTNTLQWTVSALTGAEVTAAKDGLKRQVDRAASRARDRYVTPGAGQAMTYLQKVAEAKAFQAAASPKATDYPILSAEAAAVGVTLSALASTVVSTDAQWTALAAKIEAARRGAKVKIDAAATVADAQPIADAAVKTLDAV